MRTVERPRRENFVEAAKQIVNAKGDQKLSTSQKPKGTKSKK